MKEGIMKYLFISLASLSFMACSHGPEVVDGGHAPVTFAFKSLDSSRNVNSSYNGPGGVTWSTVKGAAPKAVAKSSKKSKKGSVVSPKFIAVSACKAGEACTGEEKQKVVPREEFVSNVREKIKKSGDVVDRQEHILANSLQLLKNEKVVMEQEKAYYDYQIKTYGWSSLKPVTDGYKRSQAAIVEDLALFDMKIEKYEKDLNYLRNMKASPMAQLPTDKMMLLVDAGQWQIGSDLAPEQRVLWNFLQSLGAEIASN
jgi:hypothetical protein